MIGSPVAAAVLGVDLQPHRFQPDTYEVAISRWLQVFGRPVAAFRNVYTALAPGDVSLLMRSPPWVMGHSGRSDASAHMSGAFRQSGALRNGSLPAGCQPYKGAKAAVVPDVVPCRDAGLHRDVKATCPLQYGGCQPCARSESSPLPVQPDVNLFIAGRVHAGTNQMSPTARSAG